MKRLPIYLLAFLCASSPSMLLGQDVVLTVDLATNSMTLSNTDIGTNVQFDGYAITSPLGLLNATTWNSLEDQFAADWHEDGASSTSLLGELKQIGLDLLGPGTAINLGTGYDPAAGTLAAGFGADTFGDLSINVFNSTAGPNGPNGFPTGTVTTGRVEYIGDFQYNNLVLNVNRTSGNVELENESPSPVVISGYGIFSAANALDTGWNGLRDTESGWNEIGTASNGQLGETTPAVTSPGLPLTIAPGGTFDLGSAFSVGGTEDLTFRFRETLSSNIETVGIVKYIGGAGLACDFDMDGNCDHDDIDDLYANIPAPSQADIDQWLLDAADPANTYKLASGGSAVDVYMIGDADLNGDVDSSDLGDLLVNFGSTAGVGWIGGDFNADMIVDSSDLGALLINFGFTSAASSAAAVPEPGALSLFMLGFLSLLGQRRCSWKEPKN